MEIGTINEEDELPAVLDYMKSKGVRLIIGDVVTVDYAKKKNFVGVLVYVRRGERARRARNSRISGKPYRIL
jgi:hypothetical protein